MEALEERVDRLERIVEELSETIGREFNKAYNIIIQNDLAAQKRFKEWEERFEKEKQEREAQREKDRKEWEERFRNWEKSLDDLKREMNLKWAEMAEKLGTLVEDLVAPNIRTIAQKYFGCVDVDFEGIRVKKKSVINKEKRREFDFIVVCEEVLLLNETKSKPKADDVIQFSEFVNSGEFFEYFPEYKNKKLIPIFSSVFLTEDIVNLLTKKGIYALAFKGSEMDLLNYKEVKSKLEEN